MNHEVRRIEVLITHESPLVRAGLAATLREQADMKVTVLNGSANDATTPQGDVLIADYAAGLDSLARTLLPAPGLAVPAPKVMIVSTRSREFEIRHAMGRGIQGYFLLGCPAERLINGVRMLARGSRCFDETVTATLLDCMMHPTLTDREQDVLELMVRGAANKQIANRLDIAIGTVKSHVRAILDKLQVRSRTQAAVVAEERGMLEARNQHLVAWTKNNQRHSRAGSHQLSLG